VFINGLGLKELVHTSFNIIVLKWFAAKHIKIKVVGFLTEMGTDIAGLYQLNQSVALFVSLAEHYDLWRSECFHINILDELFRKALYVLCTPDCIGSAFTHVQHKMKAPRFSHLLNYII
jgi:hypothetical protein